MTSSKKNLKAGELKRGNLAMEDRLEIARLAPVMTPEEIGAKIRRSGAFVQKYIEENNILSKEITLEKQLENEVKASLYTKRYYASLQKQFTKDELQKFEDIWISMMLQFNQDVKFSEEMQIKEYATIEILKDRHMEDSLRAKNEIEEKKELIRDEMKKPEPMRDSALIAAVQAEVNLLESTLKSYESVHQRWVKDTQNALDKLNASRDKRTSLMEDYKTTWTGNLRLLEDEQHRTKTGQEIAILAIAAEAARQKLSEYHVYGDGVADQPLLNCDTVKDD